jgi:hypothetical protein
MSVEAIIGEGKTGIHDFLQNTTLGEGDIYRLEKFIDARINIALAWAHLYTPNMP